MNDAMAIECGVRAILAEVLSLHNEDPPPTARFFADLGGESIDVLETSFQIEKRFGVKIDFNKLLAGGQIAIDELGRVKPESLNQLKDTYPFLAVDRLGPAPTQEALKDLLTVGAITQMVKLAAGQ